MIIPIFNYKLTVVIFDKWEELGRFLPKEEMEKDWFGDGIEQKIVESAIVFWFKDADCKAENKVVEYLGEY